MSVNAQRLYELKQDRTTLIQAEAVFIHGSAADGYAIKLRSIVKQLGRPAYILGFEPPSGPDDLMISFERRCGETYIDVVHRG